MTTDTTPSSNDSMRKATGYLAVVVAVLTAVQGFLAMSAFEGAGSGALDIHKVLGYVTLMAAAAVVVCAIVGFKGNGGIIGHAASLPMMIVLMLGVVHAESWTAGLHGGLAVLVGVSAASLAAIVLRGRA